MIATRTRTAVCCDAHGPDCTDTALCCIECGRTPPPPPPPPRRPARGVRPAAQRGTLDDVPTSTPPPPSPTVAAPAPSDTPDAPPAPRPAAADPPPVRGGNSAPAGDLLLAAPDADRYRAAIALLRLLATGGPRSGWGSAE